MVSRDASGYFAFVFFVAVLLNPVSHACAQTKNSRTGIFNFNPRRMIQTINADWIFNYFPESEEKMSCLDPEFDDSDWPAVSLPHTWSTFETTKEKHLFIRNPSEKDDPYWWFGWGWYRKRFTLSPALKDRKIFIEFDGIQKYSKLWLNGQFIGDHKGGYTSFCFDITDFVRFGGENVLAVEVSNRRDDPFGGIPPMTAGNFNVYGGIYRDVRIVIKNRLYIPFQGSSLNEGGTFITTPNVSENSATVRIQTWVKNEYKKPVSCFLSTGILDSNGSVLQELKTSRTILPGKLFKFDQTSGPVTNPHLWSPETPYLYRVVSRVGDGKEITDSRESPFGFRWFHWNKEEKQLYLNGKPVHLRGTNRHQEYPWLGDAMPKWMHAEDMNKIRSDLNHNFMRTAHYPQDPLVYDLADRLGIIIMEEVPNIKDLDFSEDIQEQNLREMIRRDRNHPSIFFWSMGNETNDGADSKWAVEEDTTRILFARRVSDGDGAYIQLRGEQDIPIEYLLRCTVRGWYNEDVRDLRPENNQHAGTEEWQHEKAIRPISDDQHSLGLFANGSYWLYADHGADREYKNCPLKHINPKGWLDAYRFPKYLYYLWQANWMDRPMVFVHPHFWRSRYLGQKKQIVVDSNCDSVELKAGGVSLGIRIPSKENVHCVTFEDVPIQKGTLVAIGKKSGKTVTCGIVMAGEPARIVLTTEQPRIPADRASIAVVSADIVDANGVHVYGANPAITWSVSGPGILVGPEAYETDLEKNEEMDGVMYIDAPVSNLVRSTDESGEIIVKAGAPGLAAGTFSIQSILPEKKKDGEIVEPPLKKGNRRPVRVNPACGGTGHPWRVTSPITTDG